MCGQYSSKEIEWKRRRRYGMHALGMVAAPPPTWRGAHRTAVQLVTKGWVNCWAQVLSTGWFGLARNAAVICTEQGDLP